MARTPEAKVKDEVKKVLKEFGVFFYMPMSNGMGVVGAADFLCCYRGKFLAIETKAPGKVNNTTPNQERFLKNVVGHGGYTLVCDNADDARSFLNTIKDFCSEPAV